MSQEIQVLLETLSPSERLAAEILKTSIDCFNSKDGEGMFSGMDRYQKLSARAEIAAVQARTPFEFWGLLLRRMMWRPPPARMDEKVLSLLQQPEAADAVSAIAANSAALVMIARFWHTKEKPKREYYPEDKFEKEGNIESLFD
jgi:hypothetical protein